MSFNQCVLLLGSNIGDKYNYIKQAKLLIKKEVGEIIEESNQLETEPIGFTSNEFVLNQKIKVKTKYSPICLLKRIKAIENHLGRTERKIKDGELYADREIDIDILNFNNAKFQSKLLTIPHHQIRTRMFIKELKF